MERSGWDRLRKALESQLAHWTPSSVQVSLVDGGLQFAGSDGDVWVVIGIDEVALQADPIEDDNVWAAMWSALDEAQTQVMKITTDPWPRGAEDHPDIEWIDHAVRFGFKDPDGWVLASEWIPTQVEG